MTISKKKKKNQQKVLNDSNILSVPLGLQYSQARVRQTLSHLFYKTYQVKLEKNMNESQFVLLLFISLTFRPLL